MVSRKEAEDLLNGHDETQNINIAKCRKTRSVFFSEPTKIKNPIEVGR